MYFVCRVLKEETKLSEQNPSRESNHYADLEKEIRF